MGDDIEHSQLHSQLDSNNVTVSAKYGFVNRTSNSLL